MVMKLRGLTREAAIKALHLDKSTEGIAASEGGPLTPNLGRSHAPDDLLESPFDDLDSMSAEGFFRC